MGTNPFLTVQQVAELLDLQPSTIYQMVWKKTIPYYKPFGRRLYFKKEEILEILNKGRIHSQTELETQAANKVMGKGDQ
jgi:excisionase family DNA binding protein